MPRRSGAAEAETAQEVTPRPTRKLIGARAILDYLVAHHEIVICRQTLHRLRTDPEREFSCSEIEAGAAKFPAAPEFRGLTATVVANADEVDAWVKRHRKQTVPEE